MPTTSYFEPCLEVPMLQRRSRVAGKLLVLLPIGRLYVNQGLTLVLSERLRRGHGQGGLDKPKL